MITSMKYTLTLVVISVLFVLPALAQEPPLHACDRLAAHPYDRQVDVPGVTWGALDGQKAAVACEKGVQHYPDNPRFQYHYGRALNKMGTFEKAEKWIRKSANQGYAPAQFSLGLMYKYGEGVAQNSKEELSWIHKAAEQGFASAQYQLGTQYYNGDGGVSQDYAKALEWFRKSAEQGEEDSQFQLGNMYRQGLGVRQDYHQALDWIGQSAAQGLDEAQYTLAIMYHNGQGVGKDLAKAVIWFAKAAEQDHLESLNSLAWIAATRKEKTYRDGAKAVKLAKRVLQLEDKTSYHDTLAAAYVANNQFEKAINEYNYVIKHGGGQMIKTYQTFLKKQDYYTGSVTGRNNAETRTALESCVKAGCQMDVYE